MGSVNDDIITLLNIIITSDLTVSIFLGFQSDHWYDYIIVDLILNMN